MYKAGTRIMRLTNIEDADPFLKSGKTIRIGKHFPLLRHRLSQTLFKIATRKTENDNRLADFFYRSLVIYRPDGDDGR